ncbi:F-box domain protein [Aspergillus heteromorphus CBS 117.55]|uniref:F-box domain protein n=1 Tax=Aspergillus heteromorphus CBS 117.55 TaxID=1448321 RepID=A0A317W3V3_9EURO|nr:F-box domain protein [Aspergillus heteromorphus CBS 117.55]PWY80609.1 F-box domain protein [Aspergillus heteromorphus CBS 117.55]
MGTKGLYFVRCHGRYFVYYNQYDSYPEGLGDAIFNRDVYARLVKQLETQVFPITAQTSEEEDSPVALRERFEGSFLAVDDQLELPPLQTILPELNSWLIEWTYTLDFDREVLTVDHSLHFNLSKISRDKEWIKYLKVDRRHRRAASDSTPAGLVAKLAWKPEAHSNPSDTACQLDIQVVSPEAFYDRQEVTSPRELLLGSIFTAMHNTYRETLDGSVLEWDPSCFSFREMAFAVLSIASGALSFEFYGTLDSNHKEDGYFLKHDSDSTGLYASDAPPTVIPRLLYESHLPGVEPGSAPKGRTYWFRDVLVYLTSRLDLIEVEESAVAEAVRTGFEQGLKHFYAIVFSILDVVLLRVQEDACGRAHVYRSGLMTLFQFDDKNSRFVNGPRTRARSTHKKEESSSSAEGLPSLQIPEGTDIEPENISSALQEEVDNIEPEGAAVNDTQEESQLEHSVSGLNSSNDMTIHEDATFDPPHPIMKTTSAFSIVSRFFSAATSRNSAGASSGIFPNEVLENIMQYTDAQTYHRLAAVSAYCHKISTREFRLDDEYTVVGFDSHKGKFALKNLHSGETVLSRIDTHSQRSEDSSLCPVIGMVGSTRRSMLDSVGLYFREEIPEHPRYTKKIAMPRQKGYYFSHNRHCPGPNHLINIPDHMYVGSIEDGWGRYITGLIQGSNGSEPYQFINYAYLQRAKFPCLFPPRLRELNMEQFNCYGLHCYIRHVRDETPGEWDITMKHAVRQLHIHEMSSSADNARVRGRPVIVAFSTKLRFFFYVHHSMKIHILAQNARARCVEIASRCTEPEPERRLVPLIAQGETFDLADKELRNELEDWVTFFCGREGLISDCDPFPEEQQPPITDPDLQV